MLRKLAAGRYALEGELRVDAVAALHAAGLREFAATSPGEALAVELAGVRSADSAVLAMLVDWYAWARGHARSLAYSGAPHELRALATLSDVDHWLFGEASVSS